MDISILLVMCRSRAIWNAAGATIEDETGDINVNEDTASAAAHFCRSGQLKDLLRKNIIQTNYQTYFFGLFGSAVPSQSTTNISSSLWSSACVLSGVCLPSCISSRRSPATRVDDCWGEEWTLASICEKSPCSVLPSEGFGVSSSSPLGIVAEKERGDPELTDA